MKIVTEGISISRRRPYVPVDPLIKRAMAGEIDAEEFAMQLVSLSVDKYCELGLTGTMAYFASPGSALAGLRAVAAAGSFHMKPARSTTSFASTASD